MVLNAHRLIIIHLSVCVMLSIGITVKYAKYCGPPDEDFKYKVTPWPVLMPGQSVNATVTITPAVDVFSSTCQYELIHNGKPMFRGTIDLPCKHLPQICNLAAGETYHLSYSDPRLRPFQSVLPKGSYFGKLKLFNQEQFMWFCIEGEFVLP
ncbi:hypothetical protein ACROYT_G002187 [Oculina patagonica]